MATVVYFTSGAYATVEESPVDIQAVIEGPGPVSSLTLESGDPLYLRIDRVTHWHGANAVQNASAPARPRYGRELPRTQ